MLSCFNSGKEVAADDALALKKRLIAVRKLSNDVLSLETGHITRPATDLRRVSAGSEADAPPAFLRPNQDAVAVAVALPKTGASTSVFGVFDGHGRSGAAAATFIADAIVRETARSCAQLHANPTPTPPTPTHRTGLQPTNTHHSHRAPRDALPSALRRACATANAQLRSHARFDTAMSGTTATLCVVRDRELTCANVGDSRIMLASRGYAPPIALTHDHVPFRPDERDRIERAGGRVERWAPKIGGMDIDTGPPRVYLAEQRVPGLAVSRAFGDTILDGIITCKPDITRITVGREHSFLVLASDGLWAMMSMEHVNDFVARRRVQPAQRVAELLVEHVVELWYQAGESHSDDISVILVYLQWDPYD